MDVGAFDVWLSQVGVLTAEQRGEGFRALAFCRGDVGTDCGCGSAGCAVRDVCGHRRCPAVYPPSPGDRPGDGGGRTAPRGNRLPALRRRRPATLGAVARPAALPLQRLPPQFQRLDRHIAGPSAQEGSLGGADGGDGGGESLAKAAERCGVAPSTAFRWRHRFLQAPTVDKPAKLKGIVPPAQNPRRDACRVRRRAARRLARQL